MIRGAMLALRYMGAALLIKEAVRRLTGRPYAYRGILIDSATAFRVARALASRGVVWRQGDMVFFRGGLGTFAVPRLEMFSIFAEDLEGMYGALEVKGRAVADVGAYIGETAVYFVKRGAKYVYAYEPVFYRLTELNLRLNGVANAEVRPYGLWVEEDVIHVEPANTATGLAPGAVEIRVRPLAETLNVDAVKMDCEGCEWALLATPCGAIGQAEEYVMEIHGPAPPMLRKTERCGYKPKALKNWSALLSVWHFARR